MDDLDILRRKAHELLDNQDWDCLIEYEKFQLNQFTKIHSSIIIRDSNKNPTMLFIGIYESHEELENFFSKFKKQYDKLKVFL